MLNLKHVKNLLQKINELLLDEYFISQYKVLPKDFQRFRKMDFRSIVLFILGLPKKSLPTALDEFIVSANLNAERITKQAFSKARQKISSSLFERLFQETTNIYLNRRRFRTWKGHLLLAIDGTALQLPNTKENRKYFGQKKNQYDPVALANASILYDVLNDHIYNARITNYYEDERKQARFMLDAVNTELIQQKPIIIFDRGYPSRDFYRYLEDEKNVLYLIRSGTDYNGVLKEVSETPLGDYIITYKWKGKEYTLRVIKFTLDNGVVETLVTNIPYEDITIEMFKELYFMRWGVETKYDEIKNIFKVEKFTGIKPITIEQDFYAHMFMSNLVSMIKEETDKIIDDDIKRKNRKNKYQTNRDYLSGLVIKDLVLIITKKWMREKIIRKIISFAEKNRSQIRPNRSCERKNMRSRKKYSINKKSSI